jgi:hypothetical protein
VCWLAKDELAQRRSMARPYINIEQVKNNLGTRPGDKRMDLKEVWYVDR